MSAGDGVEALGKEWKWLIGDWETVVAVHGEFFAGIRPACTVMEVTRFVDPEWRVEIEVDAVAPPKSPEL